jgi:hypothetical protein
MHHGAVGVKNEIGPRRVLFDLTGRLLIVPAMPVAIEACSSLLASLHGGSRTHPVTDVLAESGTVCFHSRLRGGSSEIL